MSTQKASEFSYIVILRDPTRDDEDLPSRFIERIEDDDVSGGGSHIIGVFDTKKEAHAALVEELKDFDGIPLAVAEIFQIPRGKRVPIDDWYERKTRIPNGAPKKELVFEIAIFEGELAKYGDWRKIPPEVMTVSGGSKRKPEQPFPIPKGKAQRVDLDDESDGSD